MDYSCSLLEAQTSWIPEPDQAPVTESMIDVPGGRLWCWDTGGDGPAVMLLHAANGSAANWGYQQPVLAGAGFRVIAYSRRGHYRSEFRADDPPANDVEDLEMVRAACGLDRFSLLGTAAGGGVAVQYAVRYPQRLQGLVVANSLAGIGDREFQDETAVLIPNGFDGLPADYRELGASYRAACPTGRLRWLALEQIARTAVWRRPSRTGRIELEALRQISVPTLLVTGDADPFMPASRLRRIARYFPQHQAAVISEAGHSCFWEQPLVFNRLVLDHLAPHAMNA